ncbi:MAG TPA: zf-HC2 domain-containing protein [Anaeromyxobacter sp.]|nr:zf-HC2 domain-containing protein [Anaeromyxobacter sp.]
MKDCVRFAPMLGAREGELTQDEQRALDAHLEGCADCRATAAELAALDGLVGESLMARANSRDFAPFVDQVMARVALRQAQGERTGSGATARARRGFLGWLFAHPRAAIASVVPVVAVAALVVYVRSSSGGGSGEVAMFEMATEGEVTMVLQTKDGPVVLLDDGEHS